MTFKKILAIWLAVTAVSGAGFYFMKIVFKSHPLWGWAVPVLYVGVLILFDLYLHSAKGQK
jgi:hypothetical protein